MQLNVPPILMASLKNGNCFLILIPFWRFKIPKKKYFKSLIGFFNFYGSYGLCFYDFITISFLNYITNYCWFSTSHTIWNIIKFFNVKRNISFKKWIFIFCAFFGIIIIFFDPELANNFLGFFMQV